MENEEKVMEKTGTIPKIRSLDMVFTGDRIKESGTMYEVPVPLHVYSQTRFESTTLDYTWEIDRFVNLYKVIDILTSPPFPENGAQYKIEMVVDRASHSIQNKLKFYIVTEAAFAGSYSLSIMFGTSKVLLTRQKTGVIRNKVLLAEMADLQLFEHADYDPLQSLTISCKFEIFHRVLNNIIPMKHPSPPRITARDVETKLIKFKIKEEYCIVPINMLRATNSSYFKHLYTADKEEVNDVTTELTEDEQKAFKEMLLFITTGSLPKQIDCTYQDLLTIADRYDVRDLKLLCEQHLLKQINIDNAINLILLAFSCDAKCLEKYVLYFIKFNIKKIIHTEEYQLLSQEFVDKIFELTENIKIFEESVSFPPS